MSEDIWKYFSHVEVLKSREPEYFVCKQPIIVDSDTSLVRGQVEDVAGASSGGANMSESESSSSLPVKTFVSILDEGCRKLYGKSPIYSPHDFVIEPDKFVVSCQIMDMNASGKAKTKKAAKQLAAKEMLLQMVDKGSYASFGLGIEKEAAKAYLNRLMKDSTATEEVSETVAAENWVGKINEHCQKLKLQAARYETIDKGTSLQPAFEATCTVGKLVTTGQGRTKKIARTVAAQEMWKNLQNTTELSLEAEVGLSENLLDLTVEEKSDLNDKSEIQEPLRDIGFVKPNAPVTVFLPSERLDQGSPILRKISDAINSSSCENELQKLVNSEDPVVSGIFSQQELQFTFFSQKDIEGLDQCLLTLNGPKDEPHVFPGVGNGKAIARNKAAWNALIYLEKFIEKSSIIP